MPRKESSDERPKNWPTYLPYLKSPFYSPSLNRAFFSSLRTKPPDIIEVPRDASRGPCPLVRITEIKDPAHPACGQAGLFAARDLKPGSFVVNYIGFIHSSSSSTPGSADTEDTHAHSDYDLSLDRDVGIAIDADRMGNEARFVNDYRGIMARPNAEFREVWDPRRKERGMAVWVLPVGKSGKGKGIRKGEEILVSYGKGFWGARKQ